MKVFALFNAVVLPPQGTLSQVKPALQIISLQLFTLFNLAHSH